MCVHHYFSRQQLRLTKSFHDFVLPVGGFMYSSFNVKMNRLFKKREDDLPFKPGAIVSIKHEIFPDSVLSLVQETEGKYLYIAYPKEFKNYNVQLGDPICCKIKSIDCEYIIESNINNINLIYPTYIRIYVDKFSKHDNKRETKRFNVDMCSKISVYNEFNCTVKKDIKLYVKDLSLGGLYGIIPKKNLEDINNNYGLNFSLNAGPNSIINFDAEIVRIMDKELSHEVGVKIKYMNDENVKILENIIRKLENDTGSQLMKYLVKGERIKICD